MRSGNEISNLVLKAARGAGLPLGYAEELARAAPALTQRGALGVACDVLNAPLASPDYEDGVLRGGHPVLATAAWLDLAAAGLNATLETPVDADLLAAMQGKDVPVGPFEVDGAILDELARFAERTFVPESDASRLAGAGAGLTDND